MSDIIRRDPRAEWIARNRLHPLHAAMQPTQLSWMGPNGVLRKNSRHRTERTLPSRRLQLVFDVRSANPPRRKSHW